MGLIYIYILTQIKLEYQTEWNTILGEDLKYMHGKKYNYHDYEPI